MAVPEPIIPPFSPHPAAEAVPDPKMQAPATSMATVR